MNLTKRYRPSLIAIIAGVVLAVVMFYVVRHFEYREIEAKFYIDATNRFNSIQKEIDLNLEVIQSLRILYESSEHVSRQKFQGFATPQLAEHGGIQALEWIPRVSDSERAQYERAAQIERYPGFHISERATQGEMIIAANREEYYPVHFIEPYKGNELALGFDLASHPERLEALRESRDSGKIVASAPVMLVQEKEKQFGFLVFAPVYKQNALLETVEDRRKNLVGFVLGVYRIGEMISHAITDLKPIGIDFSLYEEMSSPDSQLVYLHSSRLRSDKDSMSLKQSFLANKLSFNKALNVADRKWNFVAEPALLYLKSLHRHEWITSVSILLLSCLIAVYLKNKADLITKLSHEVVERKKAEETIKQSEERLRRISDATFEGISIAEKGKIIEANQRVAEIFGYSLNEIIGKFVIDLIAPEHRDLVARNIKEDYQEAYEYTGLKKDGSRIILEIRGKTINYQGRQLREAVIRDITESKRIKEELIHSHDLLDYIIAHARSAIAVHDKNMNYVYVSDRYLKDYNVKEKNIIGKHHYEVFPDIPQKWRDVHQRVLAGEVLSTEEDSFLREDGSTDWTRWECRPWYESDGSIGGLILYTEVITERKRQEEEMRDRGRFLESLINLSPNIIYIYDLVDKKNIYCNDGINSILGYSDENINEMGDQLIPILMHPDDLKVYFEEIVPRYAKAQDGELISHQYRMKHKNGDWHWLESVELIDKRQQDGSPHQIFGVTNDITVRKNMEEELLKAQKLESIGVLAGGIAHDFNNLLTAIMNNLFIMKIHINPEEKVYERIIATERASARAQSLTQQLLTFSKGGEPVKGLIDVRELVSESISIALRGSNVRCENLIPYDAWHVEADAGQMNQAINNILINADQSMPEGGVITINCENIVVGAENNLRLTEGNYIKISFTDEGTGISDEYLSKIFDPYFTTKQKGSGLGLSTTYSIINKHGGHITVESELGAGTVFNIYLPASAEKVMTKKTAEDEPVTGTGKVLVMDDEELVRDSLGQMLISIGYDVEYVADGREAIDSYKNAMASGDSFDAVIMDLTIPGGMGGEKAIRELVEIDPNVKAIVSSGYSNDPIMSNYKDYGFSAVLTKPYKDISELSQILNNVIADKVK